MSSTSTTAGPPGRAGLPGAPNLGHRRRPVEAVIKVVLLASALISVAVTVGIVLALVRPVIDYFREISFGDFFSAEGPHAVIPLVTATLLITAIALVVAVPLGLGAAAYLSEYASRRARKVLKPTVELLAGIPSVVYGFFALSFVTPTLLQDLLSLKIGFTNALAAGLVLGVMVIPTIASLAEDAMTAVPHALRQGSLAMGANRMQTTVRVVFPAALSGIVASIILATSRAVGETMVVLIAAGSTPKLTLNPAETVQTMTAFIATTATGDIATGTIEYKTIFAVGTLLFAITLLMNVLSIRLVRRFREVYE